MDMKRIATVMLFFVMLFLGASLDTASAKWYFSSHTNVFDDTETAYAYAMSGAGGSPIAVKCKENNLQVMISKSLHEAAGPTVKVRFRFDKKPTVETHFEWAQDISSAVLSGESAINFSKNLMNHDFLIIQIGGANEVVEEYSLRGAAETVGRALSKCNMT